MKKLLKALMCFMLMIFGIIGLGSCKSIIEDSNNESSNDNSTTEESTPTETPTVVGDTGSIAIHYYRYDNNYKDWKLWLWKTGGAGNDYEFNGTDDFGAVATYPLSSWGKVKDAGLCFIVKKGNWEAKDPDGDRTINFKALTPDENEVYHIYLKTGDSTIYTSKDQVVTEDILLNEFSNDHTISFTTSGKITQYTISKGDTTIYETNTTTDGNEYEYVFDNANDVDLSSTYYVTVTHESGTVTKKAVDISPLYKTEAFGNMFNYDGKDLGANYSVEKTVFKVWSPTSTEVTVKVYNSGTPKSLSSNGSDETFAVEKMTKAEKGVWVKEIAGDLEGKYYTYVVTNAKYTNAEVVDPYAKSTGINGLRGMIVDFSKTNPDNWDSVTVKNIPSASLTVYETHVADLTSSKTWGGTAENAKLFKGFYESGTTYTKDGVTVSTGFDHVKELGVNAVQLLPIFDQKNDERPENAAFNWGYNPLNYNSLDGIYSSDPYDGYAKIKEFKSLVQAYNGAGINIIMDVVYNHMADAGGSNFDVLVPGYYFRYTNGNFSNGSGCGNETASELYMYRKFMIDSTEFWASEYKLGGFRFDLMGIHDYETMNQLADNLHTNVNNTITVYGEPWTGGTIAMPSSLAANQTNMTKYEGYGQFNDQMRDALIAGGMKAKTEKAWITDTKQVSLGNAEKITSGIRGITVKAVTDPTKSVQYVTCHDNYTLVDRIAACGITDYQTKKKMAMLANSIVFTSQGITFMLAGEEFLRSKNGDSNSYQSSYAVNALDYSLKVKNIDIFNNYKKLIALKHVESVFGKNAEEIANDITFCSNDDYSMICYKIIDRVNNREYIICHSNGVSDKLKTVDLSGYTLYLDTLNEQNLSMTSSVTVKSYQTIIAYKQLS